MVKDPNWAKNVDWDAMERILRRRPPTLTEMEARMTEARGPVTDPELMTLLASAEKASMVKDGILADVETWSLLKNALYELVERRRQATRDRLKATVAPIPPPDPAYVEVPVGWKPGDKMPDRTPEDGLRDIKARLESIPVPPEPEGNRLELADQPVMPWWKGELAKTNEHLERMKRAMMNDSATIHDTLRQLREQVKRAEDKANDSLDQMNQVRRVVGGDVEPRVKALETSEKQFKDSFDYQINIDQWQPKAVTRLQENQDNWWDAIKQIRERLDAMHNDTTLLEHTTALQELKRDIERVTHRFEYDITVDQFTVKGMATEAALLSAVSTITHNQDELWDAVKSLRKTVAALENIKLSDLRG